MVAANDFVNRIKLKNFSENQLTATRVCCTLKGSLAFTGKGHSTDRAVALGLHGYQAANLANQDIEAIVQDVWASRHISLAKNISVAFDPSADIVFDKGDPLPEHSNGMIFQLVDNTDQSIFSETYFSIGGGFIYTLAEIHQLKAPLKMKSMAACKYPFDSAASMLQMAGQDNLSIAHMKRINELHYMTEANLIQGMDAIWHNMQICLERGLQAEGILPGGLGIKRRAKALHQNIKKNTGSVTINDWLCAYAMAVNEENAAGHMVVTAPTNGAAGVIPAVLYYFVHHEQGTQEQIRDFLLTASAIGGLIKHRSSISGAEVGCQGEVGSAAAMAAAGLCAVRGGTPQQIENAAEIALEHHLGMTCDPVKGLVQVPCIERNGFGAIKAYTAASLALRGSGEHFMPLDNCIEAMKQTGMEMSQKYKETALGGLAVSITEC